jgi:fatty acid desaturase
VTATQPAYQPGVCNIGPAEIRARRLSGVFGTAATLGLFAALVIFRADPAWRLVLFVPAAGAAAGFLQAAMHFCANYGWRGVFNFGDELRDTTSVAERAAAAADRRAALRIALLSAGVGALVAAGAALLPI